MTYRETAVDLERKYTSSFVYYNNEIVYCRSFEQHGQEIVGNFQRSDAKDGFFTEKVEPKEIKTIDLDSHYFNLPSDALEENSIPVMGWRFVRRARRQNRKGISAETAYLGSYMSYIYQNNGQYWPSLGFGFRTIKALVDHQYYPFEASLALCDKFTSIALNEDFAIGLSHMAPKEHLLMSKFGFVGTVTPTAINVFHRGSYQEVCDFVKRNHISRTVELCHK